MFKTYSQLIQLPTFEARFEYLKLGGKVGMDTFGHDRYLNQILYHCEEWKKFRRDIIIRDNSLDMGMKDYVIFRFPIVHHINPLTVEDIEKRRSCIFDPENVITVSHNTHNAIHYGDKSKLPTLWKERTRGDTCPWKM